MLESLPKVTLLGNAKSGLDVGLLTPKQVLFIIQTQRPKQEVAFAGPSLVYCEVQSFTHCTQSRCPVCGQALGAALRPSGSVYCRCLLSICRVKMEPLGRCSLPSLAKSVLERTPSIHALLGFFKTEKDHLHPWFG